jgi:hypothetical protein
VTSRVRSPGTFPSAGCPAAAVTLEAGGAGTYAQRAIPGAEPSLDACALCSPRGPLNVDACAGQLLQADCGLRGGQDQVRQLAGQVVLARGIGEPFAALR